MQLIVKQLTLIVRALDTLKLATTGSISAGDACTSMQDADCTRCNLNSCLNHNLVYNSRVSLHLKISCFCDANEPRKQGFSGDAILVEHQIAIVDGVVAELHANVSDLHTRARLMCLKASDGDDKRLNSIVCFQSYTAGKDDGMCSLNAKISWPEFCSLKGRAVDDEFVCI